MWTSCVRLVGVVGGEGDWLTGLCRAGWGGGGGC